MITIPNLMSACRIVMAPVLLLLARAGSREAFLILLIVALLTDALDGLVARRLGQETAFGAKLDSWGDFGIYASLAVGAWWLWPETVRREAPFIIVAIASYAVPVLFGIWRYGRLPSHHTWGAKFSAVLMSGSAILMFGGISVWPFRCFTPLFLLSGLEDMLITATLREWRPNVRSYRHALKMKQESASGR